MAIHETATLGEFAELTGIIMRALPRAIEGLDIRETLKLAATSNNQLSGFLRKVLTSLKKPTQDQKAEGPIAPVLLPVFTIAGRTYELVPFLKNGESSVTDDTMVERAKELGANLGEEDGAFIMEHQNEIPREYQGKLYLVFTAWRDPSDPRHFAYLYCDDDRWYQGWSWLSNDWNESDRLVRRLPSTRA